MSLISTRLQHRQKHIQTYTNTHGELIYSGGGDKINRARKCLVSKGNGNVQTSYYNILEWAVKDTPAGRG